MRDFNLRPLAVAILGVTTAAAHAETTSTTSVPTTQLSTIVVSAAGFEQELKNAPASISVVTAEDLKKKGITSIADALTEVPGVDVRNGQGKTGGLNIQMRGLNQSYTLILIDGQRQNTSGSIGPNGFGEFSTSFMPPLASIERIEVIRGPMSTLYGSDAMGGIINIITKKVSSEWNGNVSVEQNIQENSEIGNNWKTSAVVNGPLIQDKLGIQVRGEFFHRDESDRLVTPAKTIDEGSQGRDPRTVEANNYAVGTKLTYNLNDNVSTWVDFDHSEQRFNNTDARLGELYEYDTDNNVIKGISSYKDEVKFLRDRISAGVDTELNFGQWKTFASYVTSEQEGRRLPKGNVPEYNYFSDGTQDRILKNKDLTVDSRIISTLGNHKVTAGVEYKDGETIDNSAGNSVAFEQDSWSIFAEDEWNLTDSLALTFGGRYEDHSAFGGHFTPRAYLVWNTNDQWTLKGGVSTGYKVPTANDLHSGINGFSSQGRNVTLGNPDLKPEETTNYELGFVYDNLSNFSLTTTAFFTQFKDIIVSDARVFENCLWAGRPAGQAPASDCMTVGSFDNQPNFGFKGNADKAESYGVELSAKYDISPSFDVKANYTWLESEITEGENKGNPIENTPRHALNFTGTWYVNDKFTTWLEAEYKSDRVRFTNPNLNDVNISREIDAVGNKLKAYELFNLGASYKVSNQVTVSGRVNNLLNKDFGDYKTFINSDNDVENAFLYTKTTSGLAGTYIPDRNYWLSLSYDF
ncbi:TonB-dependent receptor domain-containing protein [Acinetobacter pseudolwoffii]|uniref:TonB-dependent receptor domain-containing protein n=1 Tax=Acinetobacter pseudolwoffii TaxID=2053287 RepID=UPI002469B696|nr:TonB-dependent receptor [Acinetobacter pseudolwoffii]MDH5820875.1 TonB-dependent receptor [Acinetobacter pseudolwoffii]